MPTNTIVGFEPRDLIRLVGVGTETTPSLGFNNVLTLTGPGATPVTLHLDQAHDFSAFKFVLTDDPGISGTDLSLSAIACFAKGTRIATTCGAVAVEDLRETDHVLTHAGAARKVRWIGHRRIDLQRHPAAEKVHPIRIRAGALGEGIPARDLRVSPDHAMLLDGLLIPARLLVNGASIVAETDCRAVTYYHVELDRHDILLAEGAAAETYLDTGNRAMFENGGQPVRPHADFAGGQRAREALSCAPFTSSPAQVEPVWRALAGRAALLGHASPARMAMTDDPAPYLLVGHRRIDPVHAAAGRYMFVVPAAVGPARLLSRSARPGDARPWIEDPRRLGIRIRRMTMRHASGGLHVAMDDPRLEQGWWAAEWAGPNPCRWTNGDAALPVLGSGVLEVELDGDMRYPLVAAAWPSAANKGTVSAPFVAAGRRYG